MVMNLASEKYLTNTIKNFISSSYTKQNQNTYQRK